MTCPLCGRRKARRDCPALGRSICSVCCGTKRLVEINCPETCVHLSTARANPAATVRRRNEADLTRLLPTIDGLTERQHQLFFLLHSVIARHQPEGFARLADADVAEAAACLAATLETAAKGVIYEHQAGSVVAHALSRDLTTLVENIRKEGAVIYDREVAMTLRRIEQGARSIGGPGQPPDEYLTLMGRLLQINRAAEGQPGGQPPPQLDHPAVNLLQFGVSRLRPRGDGEAGSRLCGP